MDEKDMTATEQGDSFSSVLNGILSNPEMLSMVSSMAEKLKGGMTDSGAKETAPTEAVPASRPASDPSETLGALAPLLSGLSSKPSKATSDRECLLRALKPYLSQGRCEAIEYIIKFSHLTGVLKNLS